MFELVAFLALIGLGSVPAMAQVTWTDPATRLMWKTYDNGKDITFYQAADYCSSLKLGGYTD